VSGSQQLRTFRRAIRDGATLEDACAATGNLIDPAEGKLWLAADAKNPPPPEAYELIGHNLPPKEPAMAEATDERLRLLIERIERLEEEKQGIADDIRDVYAESKAVGYDPKIMRQVVRLRKMDPNERAEQETILETYMAALGMLVGTPLGDYAVRQAA